MKASEQQVLIPQEATPDTLIDLIGKTQQVTKAAAVVLKACRNVMDTRQVGRHPRHHRSRVRLRRPRSAHPRRRPGHGEHVRQARHVMADDPHRRSAPQPRHGGWRRGGVHRPGHRRDRLSLQGTRTTEGEEECGSSSTTRWPMTGASAACRSPPWDCGSSCASSTPKAFRCRPRIRQHTPATSTSSTSRTPAAP